MQKTAKKVYRKAKTKVNNKNNTLKKVGIIVAVIIVAVAIIGLNVYNYAKDSGFVERRTVAVSTENYSLSQAQMTYYFYSQYQSFYSQFSSYMDVSTYIDPSLPLTQQKCTFSNNQTWYEYFMSSAVSMAKEQLSLCEAAKKADIKLTDADFDSIDSAIDNMETQAKAQGYSLRAFIKSQYGNPVSEKDIRGAMELQLLASAYLEKVVGDADVSDETISAKYDASPDTYDKASYFEYIFDFNDIVAAKKTETETATKDMTADEKTAYNNQVKKDAVALAGDYAARAEGVTTTESFTDVVKDYLKNALGMTDAEIEKELKDNPLEVKNATLATNNDVLTWVFSEEAAVNSVKKFSKEESHTHSDSEAADTHDNLGTIYTVAMVTKTRGKVTDITTRDVRHILFSKDTYENDKKAQEVYAQWKKDATVEKFESLVKEYSEDPGSIATGGLYENVTEGQMVKEFNDWLFAEERKVDEHGVVETEHGWHIIYCVDEHQSWEADIITEIQSEASQTATEDAAKAYVPTVDYDALAKISA